MIRSKYTKKQAEQILGLQAPYTDEERKRAYREAVKRCHTDIHQDNPNAEDEIRNINEANDVLTGKDIPAFESSTFDWNDFTDSIINERNSYIRKIKKRDDYNPKNHYLHNIIMEFKSIVLDFQLQVYLTKSMSKLFVETQEKLNNKLKDLEEAFLEKYAINKEDIGEMDYTVSILEFLSELEKRVKNKNYLVGKIGLLKERLINESKKYTSLYEQLQDRINYIIDGLIVTAMTNGTIGNQEQENQIIADFNSMIQSIMLEYIKKLLQKEKNNFSNYGYSYLSDKIDDIIEKILDKSKSNLLEDNLIENILASFKKEVDSLISSHYKSLNLIDELNKFIETIESLIGQNEETIIFKNRLDDLNTKLKNGTEVSDNLKSLNNDIRTYYTTIERSIDLSNNELIKSSYEEFERKFHEKMHSLNPIKDIDTIKMMNDLFITVINLFNSLINGVTNIKDFLDCLNSIDFNDIEKSKSKINECSLGKSFIYINISPLSMSLNGKRFYLLKEEDGKLFMYYKVDNYMAPSLKRIEVTKEEIRNNFESIESILSRCNYIGKLWESDHLSRTYNLYSCKELLIRVKKDKDGTESFIIKPLVNYYGIKGHDEIDENAGYTDRSKFISEIKDRFEKMYAMRKANNQKYKGYYYH